MLLRQLRSSLIAQATFVIGVLFLIAVIRVLFVSALNWMERHDDTAIDVTSMLRSEAYLLTLDAAAGPTFHAISPRLPRWSACWRTSPCAWPSSGRAGPS